MYNAAYEGIISGEKSLPRHYYLDSSLNHARWIDKFDSSKYDSVHILGNSPGLNDVPKSLLEDKSAFVIGLNRSFINFKSDVLIFKDQATLDDIVHSVNNKIKPFEERIRNTRLIKIGMGLPKWKTVFAKDKKTNKSIRVQELSETNIDNLNEKFIKSVQRLKRQDIRDGSINLNNPEQYAYNPCVLNGDSKPTMMMVSVCNGAMHLASRLFKDNKVPIFLHGVSYDSRTYFYADEDTHLWNKRIRETHSTDFKNVKKQYHPSRDSDWHKLVHIIEKNVIVSQGSVEHRMACYYFILFLTEMGFKVKYTDNSQTMDLLSRNIKGFEKYKL